MKKAVYVLCCGLLLSGVSRAQSAGAFEAVDITGSIEGEPELFADAARSSWSRACQEWKKETKELSKTNEILAMNCETPTCHSNEFGKIQCVSTGNYKVKTAGSFVQNPPSPVEAPPVVYQQPAVTNIYQSSPPVYVESVPAFRFGFVWLPGYWWGHSHRYWYPGHWQREHWEHEHWEHEHREHEHFHRG